MRRALPWIVFLLFVAQAEEGLAECQATTCGALPDDGCTADARGCPVDGVPLSWPSSCALTVVCDHGCDDLVVEALSDAVKTWQDVACGPESAGITLTLKESVPENQVRDLILVEALDEGWPYDAAAVGRTTLEFGTTSGTLVRATISLNLESFVLGPNAERGEVDAQAVLTHELGHALGLAHSSAMGATMQAEAAVGYISELSTLDEDDEDGLCRLYPPDTAETGIGGEGGGTTPPGRGSDGCSVTRPGAPWGAGWPAGLLLLLGRLRRQKKKSRNP